MREIKKHLNNALNELKQAQEKMELYDDNNPATTSVIKALRRKHLWALKTAQGHTRHVLMSIGSKELTSE